VSQADLLASSIHVGVTADDPAAQSERFTALGLGLSMHTRLVVTASPALEAFFDAISSAACGWDGRDPIRSPA
jgi:hypothetical protein